MGYTPYKMLGHELPGPKQRTPATLKSFGTKDSDMPEKVSQKSGVLYKEGSGVGSSPAKGWFDKFKKVGKKMLDPLGLKDKAKKALGIGKKEEAPAAAGGGDTAELEARVSALEEGSSGGGNAVLATADGGAGPVQSVKKVKQQKGGWGGFSGTGLGGTVNSSGVDPILGDQSQYS